MLIKNGKIFINGQIVEKDLIIENEKIVDIGNAGSGETIDAKGLLILPGMTDVHVHLRDPGATQKEDFNTGTRAALAGGITTVMDMPNNPVPTTTAERLEEKKKLAEKKANCDVYFHFGATNENFDEVKKANPDSLKIYMARSTGNLTVTDDSVIKKHFENFNPEKRVFIHAEDQEMIDKGDRTERSAVSAIERIKKISGRKLHIVHATTKEEIELCKTIKNCTVETCPQYMFLSKKDEEKLGNFSLVYPPLRNEEKRKDLWGALGKVDCISTDHAPHTKEEKEEGARGMPGLETSLHLMLDAYNRKLLSMDWIIEKMAENPPKIYGLERMGKIEKDYTANLVFIDLKEEWEVKGEELQTKCKWSPFEGRKLKGRVKKTIFRGKLKYEEGEFY